MLDKPKRIVDKKLINEMRLPYCELCGSSWCIEVHHIVSRGAGGHDVPENLISLCLKCHAMAHNGRISKRQLKEIVARREGL